MLFDSDFDPLDDALDYLIFEDVTKEKKDKDLDDGDDDSEDGEDNDNDAATDEVSDEFEDEESDEDDFNDDETDIEIDEDEFFDKITADNINEDSAMSHLSVGGIDFMDTQSVHADLDNLSGIEFEQLILQLVRKMGFEAQRTKASGDGGIDIVAYNSQPFLEGQYIIQCKRWNSSIGEPILRDLYGAIMSERANKGILVTTSYFTPSALKFAEGKPLELIDGKKLNGLLSQYGLSVFQSQSETIFTAFKKMDGYEEYCTLKEELQINPQNDWLRYRGISIVKENALATESFKVFNNAEILLSLDYCKRELEYYKKSQRNDRNTEAMRHLAYFDIADICFIQGDFLEALRGYHILLRWEPLNLCFRKNTIGYENGLKYINSDILYYIFFNIIQIYNVLMLPEKSADMYKKCKIKCNDSIEANKKTAKIMIDNLVDGKRATYQTDELVERINKYFTSLSNITEIGFAQFDTSRCSKEQEWGYYESTSGLDYHFNRFVASERMIITNADGKAVGIEGFPLWGSSVIDNINDTRKKAEILY